MPSRCPKRPLDRAASIRPGCVCFNMARLVARAGRGWVRRVVVALGGQGGGRSDLYMASCLQSLLIIIGHGRHMHAKPRGLLMHMTGLE